MDALRIILIILGVAVIVAIYLWDRHQHKQALQRRIVSMPETDQEDEPGIVITTRTQYDDDVSADLADLRHYMGSQDDMDEADDDLSDSFSISKSDDDRNEGDVHPGEDASAVLSESADIPTTENELNEQSPENDTSLDDGSTRPAEHIVSLHIVAKAPEKFSGKDIRSAAEASGFKFGEMDIYHYFHHAANSGTEPMFSMADMYEPGYFNIDSMDSFSTRGISLFARFDADNHGLNGFEIMLDTTRKLAAGLNADILGPDRKPLDAAAADNIRRQLRGGAG